jgi:hypothetical protein
MVAKVEIQRMFINGYLLFILIKQIYDHNVTDETCAIYEAKGRSEGKVCDDMTICKNCAPGKGCWA